MNMTAMSMQSLTATYFDGRSTHGAPVLLRVNLAVGRLELEGLPAALSAPLAELRISPRLASTARVVALPGGASCESTDHDALDALERQLGQGQGARLLHRLESSWPYRLLGLALIAALLYGAVTWAIPAMAGALARATPAHVAHHFGKGVLTVLDKLRLRPTRLSTEQQAELQALFQPLAQAHPELPLRLILRRFGSVNAFALPDGTIALSDELVRAAERDEQLLGVLAHEVGHVQHRHSLRRWLAGSSATLLLAVYVSDLAQLSDWTLLLPSTLLEADFSREQESQADEFALHYLRRTGVSPKHMADMLRIFQRYGAEPGQVGQYISSHPLTLERIQMFEQ